ncbi:MAG: toll/interleukin-1 receptor domain-containing protein [Catenulispora sp.]|nr:toll/interleukin-1 receptor domain-containing protein [Catenulispora sp.]
MKIFVSYSRRDNSPEKLLEIKRLTSKLGEPYIDDLHDHLDGHRGETVEKALHEADSFVVVVTSNYLRTAWTRKEFELALKRGVPMLALKEDGTFIERSTEEWLAIKNQHLQAI